MKDFIPTLKSDREREILDNIDRGYMYRTGQDKYIYVRNINVEESNEEDKSHFFEVRRFHSDVKFYITSIYKEQKENCFYLRIDEIYLLLLEISKKISKEKANKILMSERNTILKINYLNLKFELRFFNENIPKGYIDMIESNIQISYKKLFILIALIQEKSNYYWSNSTEENRRLYTDGILRLLICLINSKDNEIIKSRGWDYDLVEDRYFPTKEDSRMKYYLTIEEYKNIMEVKKS